MYMYMYMGNVQPKDGRKHQINKKQETLVDTFYR